MPTKHVAFASLQFACGVLLSFGCESTPNVFSNDGYVPTDGSTPYVPPVVTTDASPSDASDGGSNRDAGDAAVGNLTIDGVLNEPLWSQVNFVRNITAVTGNSFAGASLARLRVVRTSTAIYIGIDATLNNNATTDAGLADPMGIVAWIDTDLNRLTGFVPTLVGFDETSSPLHRIMSNGFQTDNATIRPDIIWGTVSMPEAQVSANERIGFRNPLANAFPAYTEGTLSACTATACEASITYEQLRVQPDARMAMAVRLAKREARYSNQTLPMDSPGQPEYINLWLEF